MPEESLFSHIQAGSWTGGIFSPSRVYAQICDRPGLHAVMPDSNTAYTGFRNLKELEAWKASAPERAIFRAVDLREPEQVRLSEDALVVVHPGSLFGSADYGVGSNVAIKARDLVREAIEEHRGPLIVIDGSFSDEIDEDFEGVISAAMHRAHEAGLVGLRAWGSDDGEMPFQGWKSLTAVNEDMVFGSQGEAAEVLWQFLGSERIRVTGAWATLSGVWGCVDDVAEELSVCMESGVAVIDRSALFDAESLDDLMARIQPPNSDWIVPPNSSSRAERPAKQLSAPAVLPEEFLPRGYCIRALLDERDGPLQYVATHQDNPEKILVELDADGARVLQHSGPAGEEAIIDALVAAAILDCDEGADMARSAGLCDDIVRDRFMIVFDRIVLRAGLDLGEVLNSFGLEEDPLI